MPANSSELYQSVRNRSEAHLAINFAAIIERKIEAKKRIVGVNIKTSLKSKNCDTGEEKEGGIRGGNAKERARAQTQKVAVVVAGQK